jgi:ketosteroid isomerase-like protein
MALGNICMVFGTATTHHPSSLQPGRIKPRRIEIMKRLMILTVGVCLLFATAPVMAQSAADEAAVRKFMEDSWTLIRKHDSKALGTLYSATCENFTGTLKGAAAMEKMWMDFFATNENIQMKQSEEIGIHFITPEVVAYKARYEVSGRIDSDGKPTPPSNNAGLFVLVKEDGRWLFETWHLRVITP